MVEPNSSVPDSEVPAKVDGMNASTSLLDRVVRDKPGVLSMPEFYGALMIVYVAALGYLLHLLWRAE